MMMTDNFSHLTLILREAMRKQGGAISFAQFMQAALYDPQHGYYSSGHVRFGKQGDFTTAAEISPLYAQCFANQCQNILNSLPAAGILELGAGSGRFAGDFLTELAHWQHPLPSYAIYEISPSLRQRQQLLIEQHYPAVAKHITWLSALPNTFTGVIIANEVLDALPVHCFCIEHNTFKERCVTFDNDQLSWVVTEPTSAALAHAGNALLSQVTLAEHYQSEISLAVPQFVTSLCQCLQQGVVLFADYGYGRAEYYHPLRQLGSLTCFYQQQKHDDPLFLPGQQDITAHVNFTQVIESADAGGGELAGYTTQAAFLLNCGLRELAMRQEQSFDAADLFTQRNALKLLTMPTEMGERIKIMAISKNYDQPLLGFSTQDKRHEL